MQVRLPAVFPWSAAALMTKQRCVQSALLWLHSVRLRARLGGAETWLSRDTVLVPVYKHVFTGPYFWMTYYNPTSISQVAANVWSVWADVNAVFELRYAPTGQPNSGVVRLR